MPTLQSPRPVAFNPVLTQTDDWLRIDRALPDIDVPLRRLLELNEALPGAEKLCLDLQGMVHLRADVPTVGEMEDADRAASLCAGVTRAVATLNGPAGPEPSDIESIIPDFPAICMEFGWPFVDRAANHWMVELNPAPHYCQAEVTVRGNAFDVRMPLGPILQADEVGGEAVNRFLLLACGVFRMIRTAIAGDDGRPIAFLIARVPFRHAPSDLNHALSALSVAACRLRQEFLALSDPIIAARYLDMVQTATPRAHGRTVH